MGSRHTRNIWYLLVLVIVLGLAVIAETLRERGTAPLPLLRLDGERIDDISIECSNCVSRRFQRVQGQWQMVHPWQVTADATQIARLIEIGSAPLRRRFESTQIDPLALGFAPPFATLILGSHRIEFGTTEAINHARYVRVAQQLALVHDRVSVLLVSAAERFVDPNPFSGLRPDRVQLEGGEPWAPARVAALMALRADAVSVGASRVGQRVLLIRDVAGVEHRYGLLLEPSTAPSLLRDDPPLVYALPAAAASLFAD